MYTKITLGSGLFLSRFLFAEQDISTQIGVHFMFLNGNDPSFHAAS